MKRSRVSSLKWGIKWGRNKKTIECGQDNRENFL